MARFKQTRTSRPARRGSTEAPGGRIVGRTRAAVAAQKSDKPKKKRRMRPGKFSSVGCSIVVLYVLFTSLVRFIYTYTKCSHTRLFFNFLLL
jgi:hypothetical protein